MNQSTLLLVTALLCGGVLSRGAVADDARSTAMGVQKPVPAVTNVETGSYKPLTFWHTVSLGTSYYTDPQRARSINVAYTYDGPEFSADFRNNAIWKLANEKKISFGIVDQKDKSVLVVDLAELSKRYNVHSSTDLPALLARDDIIVVASEKELLGYAASTTVVKTK